MTAAVNKPAEAVIKLRLFIDMRVLPGLYVFLLSGNMHAQSIIAKQNQSWANWRG
jgi:hypothetical protein